MSVVLMCKMLAVTAILGYISVDKSESTPFNPQDGLSAANYGALQSMANNPALLNSLKSANSADSEDDDEDDDVASNSDIQQATDQLAATLNYNNQSPMESQYQAAVPISAADLKTAASHHHHGHSVKGWLDMGAWTGKKGAFGWHDKHPVGGKKGRK